VTGVLNQLTRQYPRIVFDLPIVDPEMAYRALEECKVDLAILHINVPVTGGADPRGSSLR
jgi:hypothetical protein